MQYKSFFNYLKEDVEKYLIWKPTGVYRKMVDKLNKLQSLPNELYRGCPDSQITRLKTNRILRSSGRGNTREEAGTYVSADIHLASAFALRYFRERLGGHILILDKEKLPTPVERDPGNYTVEYIPIESVKRIIDLNDLI